MFPSPITGEMYHSDSVVNLHKKNLKDAGFTLHTYTHGTRQYQNEAAHIGSFTE